jgi:hypothetical protein
MPLISIDELEVDGVNSKDTINRVPRSAKYIRLNLTKKEKVVGFVGYFPAYLGKLEHSRIWTLEELVEFNRAHADR